jgi:isopenicillin N synthase-like dioxygenase
LTNGGANRISEHTDFGTVTLLFQDSVGGLEVEDQSRHGSFIPVKNDHQAEMIVNIEIAFSDGPMMCSTRRITE